MHCGTVIFVPHFPFNCVVRFALTGFARYKRRDAPAMHRAQKGRLENVPEQTDTEVNSLFLDEQHHIHDASQAVICPFRRPMRANLCF